MRVPRAENVEAPVEAPAIDVFPNAILLDGTLVGVPRAIEESGNVASIEELVRVLRDKKELATPLGVDADQVQIAIDVESPGVVVKSVVRSAAEAGFPKVGFLVKAR